ncbi:MAG: O-antigen ligase family protein, partial [candidate division Zixibacteria bacterium]|nr:O-antigen ligase family protein [candidate division Zixibacteria bacterium]
FVRLRLPGAKMLRRLMTCFFLLFVFSSTFSIAISQTSLGICVLFFVAAAIRERFNPFTHELRWFWLAVTCYIGWLVIVCLLQDDPLHALNNIREEWLFVIVPVGLYLMRDRETIDLIATSLAVGLLLISIVALLSYVFRVQYHWGDGFIPLPETNPRVSGNFSTPLTFGNFAAVGSLVILSWVFARVKRWAALRITALLGGVLGLVAVLFCGGRGPALAGMIGLIVLLLLTSRTGRRWGLAVMIAVLLVGVLTPSVRSRFTTELGYHFNPDWPGSRLFIWGRSLEMVADHPLIGVGPGNFDLEYKQRLAPDITDRFWYQHAHNDFLEAAARSGLLGAATFGLLWVAVFGSLFRRWPRTAEGSPERELLTMSLVGSVVFLAASMTEATFSDEEVRTILMLVWALGLSAVYNQKAGVSPAAVTVT